MRRRNFRHRGFTKIAFVVALVTGLFGLPASYAADGERQPGSGCSCHQNCAGAGISQGGSGR